MAANTEFEYIMNKLFGVDTLVQLLCFEKGITNLHKLKAKWKIIRKLEYTDSTSTNTKVKLSDDD